MSRLLFCMQDMFVATFLWTSTKNEWNAQNVIWSNTLGPSITHNLITGVLTNTRTYMYMFCRTSSRGAHRRWRKINIVLSNHYMSTSGFTEFLVIFIVSTLASWTNLLTATSPWKASDLWWTVWGLKISWGRKKINSNNCIKESL